MTSSPAEALLLIDFQRDFLEDDGRMPVARGHVASVVEAARAALAEARARGALVVAIGNEYPRSAWFMNLLRRHAAVAGTPGTAWEPRLGLDGVTYLPKWAQSAFCNPSLEPLLRSHAIRRLTLAGLFARACVSATAREAMARNFEVRVLSAAVACASDRSRSVALERLRRRGAQLV